MDNLLSNSENGTQPVFYVELVALRFDPVHTCCDK